MRNRRPLVRWAIVLTFFVLAVASAVAFQDDTFKPVKPGEPGQETLPATPLVFVAYAFVWTLLLAYVFLLWRKLGRVERELAEVNTRLRTGARTP